MAREARREGSPCSSGSGVEVLADEGEQGPTSKAKRKCLSAAATE